MNKKEKKYKLILENFRNYVNEDSNYFNLGGGKIVRVGSFDVNYLELLLPKGKKVKLESHVLENEKLQQHGTMYGDGNVISRTQTIKYDGKLMTFIYSMSGDFDGDSFEPQRIDDLWLEPAEKGDDEIKI